MVAVVAAVPKSMAKMQPEAALLLEVGFSETRRGFFGRTRHFLLAKKGSRRSTTPSPGGPALACSLSISGTNANSGTETASTVFPGILEPPREARYSANGVTSK